MRLASEILRTLAFVPAALAALAASPAPAQEPLVPFDPEPAPPSPFAAVARLVSPSVVTIRTDRDADPDGVDTGPMEEMYRRFFPDGGGAPFSRPGSGTGFVASRRGHILTNDPASDLAVLLIEPDRELAPLVFADSDLVQPGDWALAVGNPFGNLAGSLTVGVVSAKGRADLVIAGGTPQYQDFLQTDAAINFGNSGGPLVDIAGRVIGVNTAVNAGGQGIGFAIPGNFVRRVLEQIVRNGRVVRAYLGARVADSGDGRPGALVVSVIAGSPAAAAGLSAGDLITGFAGSPVDGERSLMFLLAESDPGAAVDCEYRRAGESGRCLVELVEAKPAEALDPSLWRGMELADAAGRDPRVQRLREVLGGEVREGLMVVRVVEGGPADEAGLRAGDLVDMIADRRMAGLADFRALRLETAGSGEALTLRVWSGGEPDLVSLGPDPAGRER